jgi:dienelactone hydrolase
MPIGAPQPSRTGARLGAPSSHEVLLARAALALIALAIVDDGFVHPEPGTTAADHLLTAGLPLAVALVVALAYPRLRAGARACAALVCGGLAVAAGSADGIRHVAVDRLSGDDASAVLATLAGLALLIQGAVVLWRSRRPDEPRARRYARRAVVGAGALALVLFAVVPAGVAILATHKARAPVAAADLGRPYERVGFTTADGLRLAGWYVPSRNRVAVIVFPGRSGTLAPARMLVRHGYGVLLFDRRGEGESEGDINLYGWDGEPDLAAAIGFLRARRDVDPGRIGGLGLSVGGELLLQAAAHTPALRAVVSEGAGARSLAEHLRTPGLGRLQRWLTPAVAQTAAVAVLSGHRPPGDLADLVRRIPPRRVLLIRALDGHPDELLNRVYAANAHGELWEVGAGGHTGALAADPRTYERVVLGFLDRTLLAG